MANEARKIEKELRSHLLDPKNEAEASIDPLKSVAESLKTRLDLTVAKAALQNHQPSGNNSSHNNSNSKPSMVQLMFASFIKDPDVSRSSLVQCIEMLDAELSSLEQQHDHSNMEENQDAAAANSRNSSEGDAIVDDNNQIVTESSTCRIGTAAGQQSSPSKKRARVAVA
jgi:hypothetical protein